MEKESGSWHCVCRQTVGREVTACSIPQKHRQDWHIVCLDSIWLCLRCTVPHREAEYHCYYYFCDYPSFADGCGTYYFSLCKPAVAAESRNTAQWGWAPAQTVTSCPSPRTHAGHKFLFQTTDGSVASVWGRRQTSAPPNNDPSNW